jgi:hypothetical protein
VMGLLTFLKVFSEDGGGGDGGDDFGVRKFAQFLERLIVKLDVSAVKSI